MRSFCSAFDRKLTKAFSWHAILPRPANWTLIWIINTWIYRKCIDIHHRLPVMRPCFKISGDQTETSGQAGFVHRHSKHHELPIHSLIILCQADYNVYKDIKGWLARQGCPIIKWPAIIIHRATANSCQIHPKVLQGSIPNVHTNVVYLLLIAGFAQMIWFEGKFKSSWPAQPCHTLEYDFLWTIWTVKTEAANLSFVLFLIFLFPDQANDEPDKFPMSRSSEKYFIFIIHVHPNNLYKFEDVEIIGPKLFSFMLV